MSIFSRWVRRALALVQAVTFGAAVVGAGLAAHAPAAAAQELGQGGFTAGPSDARPRVVGGRRTGRAAWPSFALLMIRGDADKVAFCGGTVIAPEWVLTAGHCATGIEAARVTVHEGLDDMARLGSGLPVRQVVVHEGFRGAPEPVRDIALLRLARPARSPAQRLLSQAAALTVLRDGLPATVAGFGATRPRAKEDKRAGSVSQILRQAELPVVEQAACRRILERVFGRPMSAAVDGTVVCAGDASGQRDACNGDSGGPLMVDPGDGAPVQAGIVSWGPGCAQRDTVGVYASVGAFEPWIRRHVPGAIFHRVQGPAPAQRPPSVAAVEALAGIYGAEGDRVRVTIPEGRQLRAGSLVRVRVESEVPGTLMVYNVDLVSGTAYRLLPNEYRTGCGPGEIAAGGSVTIPAEGDRFQIRLHPPAGPNRIYAFVLPPSVQARDLATRGRAMEEVPDAAALFGEIEARTRGPRLEPKEEPRVSGRGAAGVFAYEILP